MFGKKGIDVCIVSTLRPEILERTLDSLSWHVRTERCILNAVLNVDATPDDMSATGNDILTVAAKYMHVGYVNFEGSPSFSRAVRRVWENTQSRYVLHLEDDWEFVREINLDWCIEQMELGRADYIRFSKRDKKVESECFKPSLLPSLWCGEMVRALSQVMVDDKDPEKQLRRGLGNEKIDALLPIKIMDYPGGVCVRDIGREWREKRGLVKWNKQMESGEDTSYTGAITWKHG